MKGLAIIFVVIAHCSTDSNNICAKLLGYISFVFVMPVFFSISGYLYRTTKSINNYIILIYKKITSILLPYFIFSFFYFIYDKFQGKNFPIYYILFGFKINGVLWFLLSLFIIFVITGLFDLLHINYYVRFILFIGTLILSRDFWMYAINSTVLHPEIYLIYSYFIFFNIGVVIKKYRKSIYNFVNKYLYIYIILFIILVVIQINITSLKYQTNFITVSDLLPKFMSVFLFFNICKNFSHNFIFRYFDKYGKYTLIIYLIHPVFQAIFNNIIILMGYKFKFLSIVILVWVATILSCRFIIRCKVINIIFYPRKYINHLIMKTKLGRIFFN